MNASISAARIDDAAFNSTRSKLHEHEHEHEHEHVYVYESQWEQPLDWHATRCAGQRCGPERRKRCRCLGRPGR